MEREDLYLSTYCHIHRYKIISKNNLSFFKMELRITSKKDRLYYIIIQIQFDMDINLHPSDLNKEEIVYILKSCQINFRSPEK